MRNLLIAVFTLFAAMATEARPIIQDSMAKIEGGEYQPRFWEDAPKKLKTSTSRDRFPPEKVKPFWMDQYAVTNQDFEKFVLQNPQWNRQNTPSIFRTSSYLQHWKSDSRFEKPSIAQSPMNFVSWFAARAYCHSLGKRLPTTTEWEYVAQASSTQKSSLNAGELKRWIHRWENEPRPQELPSVGSTYQNYWGIFDLHGLIWEWVEDFNSSFITGQSHGIQNSDRKLFCGDGLLAQFDFGDVATFSRYSFRSAIRANHSSSILGFRCAKDAPSSERK